MAATQGKRIAVVTGGNKGIGLEICRKLVNSQEGLTLILTARDEKRGTEAVEKLGAKANDVLFHRLDVVDKDSVSTFAAFIKDQFGKLDILVNNAGVFAGAELDETPDERQLNLFPQTPDGRQLKVRKETYEEAEITMKTNYYGVKNVTEALLPLLQQSNSARIVNVSSSLGLLKYIPNENTRKKLGDVDGLTEEKLDEVVKEFLEDAKKDRVISKGWPPQMSSYGVSKAAVVSYTRILAKKYPNILVNAVHPGYVATDMNLHAGYLSVEEGARGPAMLALLPDDGPTGLFYDETEPFPTF
ncbi:hypothetical protein Dimus_033004 [Dionaea muscipula]